MRNTSRREAPTVTGFAAGWPVQRTNVMILSLTAGGVKNLAPTKERELMIILSINDKAAAFNRRNTTVHEDNKSEMTEKKEGLARGGARPSLQSSTRGTCSDGLIRIPQNGFVPSPHNFGAAKPR